MVILHSCFKIDTNMIKSAKNGKHAVELVEENIDVNRHMCCDFNLILMDCNMPFMDGYEAT